MMSPATGKRVIGSHVSLSLRVQPRAAGNGVVGWTGDTLNVRLTAPPVEGAANAACLALLADLLSFPQSQLEILRGERSRNKVVQITGLTRDEVRARLGRS